MAKILGKSKLDDLHRAISSSGKLTVITKKQGNGQEIIVEEKKLRMVFIKKLVKNNPELINMPQGKENLTALHKAVQRKDIKLLDFFINNGGNLMKVDKYDRTALDIANNNHGGKKIDKDIMKLFVSTIKNKKESSEDGCSLWPLLLFFL